MKHYIKALSLILALGLTLSALASCGKSPSPSDSGEPFPSGGESPGQTGEESPSPSDMPSVPGDPTNSDTGVTDEPSPPESRPPENPSWPANNVTVRENIWSQSYSDSKTTYLEAGARMPQLSGVPDTVVGYFDAILEDFKRKCESNTAQAKSDYQNGVLSRPYEMEMDFFTECNSGGIISIRRVELYDSGGMKANMKLYCENFSVSDGRFLFLDDFFTVSREEYLPVLLGRVHALIDENPEDYFDSAKKDAGDLFPYETFNVTTSGLSLFYAEQSIAADALGIVRVYIGWEYIGDIWQMP